jgi:hypothetical protein
MSWAADATRRLVVQQLLPFSTLALARSDPAGYRPRVVDHVSTRASARGATSNFGRRRNGPTSDERERIKSLERENRELRQANEILRKASAYFAMAELDRRSKP